MGGNGDKNYADASQCSGDKEGSQRLEDNSGVIAALRALTQYKRKSCRVRQDPQLTPNKSIKILGRERETNPACPPPFFFSLKAGTVE